jgi:hypothetical protein
VPDVKTGPATRSGASLQRSSARGPPEVEGVLGDPASAAGDTDLIGAGRQRVDENPAGCQPDRWVAAIARYLR